MKQKLISVVITSNKNNLNISKTLDSLIDHHITEIEYLVNLDGYDDANQNHLQAKYPMVKFTTFHGTISETVNKLIRLASGDYLARADDDDIYINRRLFLQKQYLDFFTDIDVVGADIYIDHQTGLYSYHRYLSDHDHLLVSATLGENWVLGHGTAMLRRRFFEKLAYAPITDYLVEDFHLWVQGFCNGYRFANINIPLMIYTAPNYSAEKQGRMKESVIRSSVHLLETYFKVPSDVALLFVSYARSESLHSEETVNAMSARRIVRAAFERSGIGRNSLESVSRRTGFRF